MCLKVDGKLIALSDKSRLPLVVSPSLLPDLRSLYVTPSDWLIPLPALPIAHDRGAFIYSPSCSASVISNKYVSKAQLNTAAGILKGVMLNTPTLPTVRRVPGDYIAPVFEDTLGRKYHHIPHGGRLYVSTPNIIDATVHLMHSALPLPENLVESALSYLTASVKAGYIPSGLLYHEDGFTYFGD